ncbi:MAG: O-antigen ligase family protein [Planctomycetaceae bacterium]
MVIATPRQASFTHLERWLPVNALLPLIICFYAYKESRKLAAALLVIWMAWRLLVPLLEMFWASDRRGPVLPHVTLFLALLLVNARVISLRGDVAGPSQFLLIVLGVVIGTLLCEKGWSSILSWLGFSAIPLGALFLWHGVASGLPLSLGAIEKVYNMFLAGHGGISRFATLVMLLTLCAWYGLLLRAGKRWKFLGFVAVFSGYALCLGSGSRVAQVVVPLALSLSWAVQRLKGQAKRLQRRVLFTAVGIPLALALWWFVVGPEAATNRLSDFRRMEAARCWLALMWSGRNRFIFGVGYGSEVPNQFCRQIPDFRGQLGTIGHAHNTVAQMGGQHGILGILALFLIVLLVVLGLRRQLSGALVRLPIGPGTTPWAEVSLGLNLALAFNALATTIHISNQVNQVLIGLLAASALRANTPSPLASDRAAPTPPVPGGSQLGPGGVAP